MTPNIGDTGKFSVAAPFVNDLYFTRSLEVLSLTGFAALVNDGKEPFSLYYEPHGLTTSDYKRDIANKESIVTFASKNGDQYSLPSSYILAIPQGSGEEYVKVSVVIQLPAMWRKLAYNHYMDTLREVTMQSMGVVPTDINLVAIGEPVFRDDGEHVIVEAERNAIRQEAGNNYLVELVNLREQVTALRSQVTVLEKFIVDNH